MKARFVIRVIGGGALAILLASAYAVLEAQSPLIPQVDCGNEGQVPCSITLTNLACDTGLQRTLPTRCGCLLSGPFGGCLIPQLCTKCVNFTRRLPSVNAFQNSWVDWALRNQRTLAQDEPVNWVMNLGTHNSFNTRADGHAVVPNQVYSMTDQLRAGARALSLDMFQLAGDLRLCHGGSPLLALAACAAPGNPLVYNLPPGWRYLSQGIKELRNWLALNPGEIIFISLENWALEMGATPSEVRHMFGTLLGSRIVKNWHHDASGFAEPRWPTRREMQASNQQVIILDDARAAGNEFAFRQQDVIGGFSEAWYATNMLRYPNCDTSHILETPPVRAQITVEERELMRLTVGTLDAADIAAAAECNYAMIVLDKYSAFVPQPPGGLDLFDATRTAAAVWSWNVGDRGQHGACAMVNGDTGRWSSAGCTANRRFACAPPRSEAGLDPLEWTDRVGEDWRITAQSGPWDSGQSACESEFPGYNFSVPVNGYQNRKLRDANTAARDLWVNYSQREVTGRWAIGRLPVVSAPPIAEAGADQTLECTATAMLDGSASRDPQGDALSYTWTGPFGTLSGPQVAVTLPPGEHAITLTVSDGHGGSDTDTVTITVNDTTPPAIALKLSPGVLWPPNNKFVTVVAEIQTDDVCDADPPSVELISVVSSFDPKGKKGTRRSGIASADLGTDDRELELRATRWFGAHDLTYAVTYRATDAAGNQAHATEKVVVANLRHTKKPHLEDRKPDTKEAKSKVVLPPNKAEKKK